MKSTVSLIVPIYRGIDRVQACLESIVSAEDSSAVELILINDASPEPSIAAFCQTFIKRKNTRLVEHSENLGFVASVNEGFRIADDNDVIILNSDTEVPPGWIKRICSAAERNPRVASVTPFSNNATICSYPELCIENFLPEGLDYIALDKLFASANSGATIEIPTGVGFCMFIRREAWRDVGEFDEAAFGRGYGEENDWCMRATAKGWRHLLCADLFVYHAGGVSFGEEAASQQQKALKVISARYPNYERTIAEFIERDPAEPLRHALDLDRARLGSSDQVLSEYRRRLLGERDARYKLDKDRHQQVQTLGGLLADAREHVADEARRYEQILTQVRAEAAQTDSKYAAQIEQMAQGYAELEAQTREAEAQIRSLSEELDSLNRNWLVRLHRWLFMRRNKV